MAKATTADTATDKVVKTGKPGKAAPAAKPNFFARVAQYFRDVRAEMNRVVWPTRPEVLNSSVVVVTAAAKAAVPKTKRRRIIGKHPYHKT